VGVTRLGVYVFMLGCSTSTDRVEDRI
jgi:hypothetical protein